MRVLDVSRNKLKELPVKLHFMQRLQYLDFSHNAFSKFPSKLCQLNDLFFLKASHNSLSEIPACIHLYRALEHFDVSDNPMQKNLPSTGLLTLATDYNLHFLNLSPDHMKLLNPDVCSYLQSRGILPQYHLRRSPAMYNVNSVQSIFHYVQHMLFSE
jgi:Leucine-rich repeat (LRR) protein